MSVAAQTPFDPDRYKETTRDQWEDAAAAWHRWGPTIEAWLREPTEFMLDLCRVGEGDRVLDVAAGAGGQAFAAARRVGPSGSVLATDISPAILGYASDEARRLGLANVATRTMDGEDLGVEPETFDAVISRLGLIYFPDRPRALAGMRAALAPSGRIGAIVYSSADRNEFFSIPVSVIRRRAQLPPPAPGQPGPFSLAGDALRSELAEAGFRNVDVRTVPAPLRLESAAECVRFERESFGALHQMLAGVGDDEREAAWDEILTELHRFEGPDGFAGPCELLVAAAER